MAGTDGWHERPTVLLLHGGPGADHAVFKPRMSALARWAQVIYLDQRGGGRSFRSTSADWNLRTWTNDVRTVCETLGVERPILLGQSFGTLIAMCYAIEYPDRTGGLILASPYASGDFSTSYPLFEKLGGAAAGQAARRFWEEPTPSSLASYRLLCAPLYPGRPALAPIRQGRPALQGMNDDVLLHYVQGEHRNLDLYGVLHRIRCQTLILSGQRDPLTPPSHAHDIASAMRPSLAKVQVLAGAGHHVFAEAPRASLRLVQGFLQGMI
ncbi:alpha/beta fold hydrolase [Micromonospora sp. KC207]|uniref:alpha/beta fold hydrolase n=1 Tax=Micromonospora sp. KC207 TaxID=2530377 RepID=UPI001404931A|nr:alpha/beta hydrolase [Micromonospora sp. KC207]